MYFKISVYIYVFKLVGGASAVEPASIAVDGEATPGRAGGVSSLIFLQQRVLIL